MDKKITTKILILTALTCLTGPVIGQSIYGSNNSTYSTTTVRPDYSGGYNASTFSDSGYSSSTIRPDYSGGYTINSYGSSGNSTTTVRPDYSGGYSSSTYNW